MFNNALSAVRDILRLTPLAAVTAATVVATWPCAAQPPRVSSPPPSARACPAPALEGVTWAFVDDSTGYSIALPRGFQERPSGGPFRHWQLAGDFQQSMSFGIIRGDLGMSGYRRLYQPSLMLEYSDCLDDVDGHPIFVQAWRTPNGVLRNFRRMDRYDVYAIWQVQPGVYEYMSGGTYVRPSQDLILGAVRAWRRR